MTTTLAPVGGATEPMGLAGALLELFVRRDYDAMPPLFDPEVHFRALVPPGLVEGVGPGVVLDRFRTWFGTAARFEVQDATVGHVGPRPYLRWRVFVGDATGERVAEQHLYLCCGERIDTVDLLCSGFQVAGGKR